MEDNIKTNEDSYWSKMRHFAMYRTGFWVNFGFEVLFTIIPFILIWLFLGADFQKYSFNHYLELGNNNAGFLTLILLGYIITSLGLNAVTVVLKLQRADSFTYTTGLAFAGACIILNGSWIYDWTIQNQMIKILVRFAITIGVASMATFLGVFITTFARNHVYKVEEDQQQILEAYRAGLPVPSKAMLKIQRAEKAELEREQRRKELEEFQFELDKKLIESYDKRDEDIKAKKRLEKLNAKEAKQRNKDKKN
ncbi:DxFTY motif-containing membrane protein [[Acholeplasma] multilocale]|uniref:DxFTY motif-containing membrane protein n=1 Tax=[Acholeplasma] multilocale TaxID=264638 RepID=UPI00047AAF9C|nr:hypothetical protein [[Acholeplasma] multilocale]